MTPRKTVLLNADHSILNTVSLSRAINLYLNDKAVILAQDEATKIIHPSIGIKHPSVIALKKFIYVPFRNVKMSRKNIFLRDKYKCQYCGIQLDHHNATVDHVIPRSHAHYPGPMVWENVATCCRKCNGLKDNKTPKEAGMKLLNKPFAPKAADVILQNKQLEKIVDDYQNKSKS